MTDKNIYQRIADVMRKVEYIKKDKKVDTYMAVTYDNVVAACRAELIAAGVMVYTEQVKAEMLITRDVKADVKMHLYSGTYNVHFVNVDKPDDRVTVAINAHANDNGDKAPGKCVTYATKTAILKVLLLETGENDESRAAPDCVDLEGILEEIPKIVNLESLRIRREQWMKECQKHADKESWESIKTACAKRKDELSQ